MLKPLFSNILIQPIKAEKKTESGLYIPDTTKENPNKGLVIAVGPGTEKDPMIVKVGDTVLHAKFVGTEIEYEGEKYSIIKQSDVLAIL